MENGISVSLHQCCEKGSHCRRQAFRVDKQYYCRDVFPGWVDLAYDMYTSYFYHQNSYLVGLSFIMRIHSVFPEIIANETCSY